MGFIDTLGNYLSDHTLFVMPGVILFMVGAFYYASLQPKRVSPAGFDAPTPAARIALGVMGLLIAAGGVFVLVMDMQDPVHHSGHAYGSIGSAIVLGIGLAVVMLFRKEK